MKKNRKIGLDFQVDKLTNSIENVITGDSFPTDITIITAADLKNVTKKTAGSLTGKLSSNNLQEMFTCTWSSMHLSTRERLKFTRVYQVT